jgi:hypothetical protein
LNYFVKKASYEALIEAAAGSAFGGNYWSSSESNDIRAYIHNLINGADSNAKKHNEVPRVRAIRTFSGSTGLSNPGSGFN